MNLSIKNIRLEELDAYLDSEEYRNSSFVPISKIRAISHQNNPRAEREDYCLFLAYDADKFIGYLGAVTDQFFYPDSKVEKVFWLSCMWVLPEYRRHGIAFELLNHAYNVFKGKVLITNFISQSKGAFDKTDQYISLPDLQGIRGYCLLDFATILLRKNPKLKPLKFFFRGADSFGNFFIKVRLKYRKSKLKSSLVISEVDIWDDPLKDFITTQMKDSTFRRNSPIFSWMKEFPWVKHVGQISEESKRYYFSQEGTDYKQWFLKAESKGTPVAFLLLTHFKNELKIPYMLSDNEYIDEVAHYIASFIIENEIKTFVCYYPELNKSIQKHKIFYLTRNSSYGFLIGKGITDIEHSKVKVHPGDGDGAFT